MEKPYQIELEVARRLAREAGMLAMKYYRGRLEVDLKDGDEPVTEADRRASELIVDGLRQRFPDDVIISEESADDLRRLEAERVWYVDPIDGTRDFIHGREGFAVMIGLAREHRPAVGVVYQPVGDRTFWAGPDGGWYDVPGQEPRRLAVSRVSDVGHIRLVASRSSRSRKIDTVKRTLGISGEHNIGSVGLKLAIIALGEQDLYVNPSPRCKTWDTCAPEAILNAAGGRMTDVDGAPLRYDLAQVDRPRGLVASNGWVHEAVLERLRPLFPAGRSPDE